MTGARVVITGGTGTFGKALTASLLRSEDGPTVVRILSRDEVKQSEMRRAFGDDPRLRFMLGDVRDYDRLLEAFDGATHVFHAAAMKRVEACAYDPGEAIATNVRGSVNVARAALERGVGRVVALSSDKACAPSTVYGATKLCAEAVFTSSSARAHQRTRMCAVRYGNVMGSRGSVLEIWREQARSKQKLSVVNPTHTRFWYTIREAVQLALWASTTLRGGELYVPRLRSFMVGDLARAVLNAHHLPDSFFERISAREGGEKHHESLISMDESFAFRLESSPCGNVYVRSHEELPVYSRFEVSSENSVMIQQDELDRKVREFL